MGANVCMMEERGGKIYFYSHFGGKELPITLKNALVRGKSRWGDEPYLARIIFSEMIKGNEDETTGYGISTYETDNDHPILYVNSSKKEVTVRAKTFTFNEFIEQAEDDSLF